jgi:hypothetical protein
MGLIQRGPGAYGFIDETPMDITEMIPEFWDPRFDERGLTVHGYADVFSERVGYGIALMEGGPSGEVVDSREVGSVTYAEHHSITSDLPDALEHLKSGSKYHFEENPFVVLETEDEYREALKILDIPVFPEDWDPRKKTNQESSMWTGPGLYDFRNVPPTKSFGSIEEYEAGNMEFRADECLDMMHEDDETLKEKLREILEGAAE